MIQRCKDCQKQYDVTKQSSLCPHREHFKMCKEHSRIHCGMPNCNKEQGENNANSDRNSNNNITSNHNQYSIGG